MNAASPKYVIDTCSLIKLQEDYPSDVFPAVWDTMNDLALSGILISSAEVLEELRDGDSKNDEILEWAENHLGIFYPLDGFIQTKAIEILGTFDNIVDLKKKKSSADAFVIATAIMNACIVVSDESITNNLPGSGKRVKIPDVCKYYNFQCISLLDMMRNEGVKFSLIQRISHSEEK
jgi:hypothetical protein